MKTSIFTIIFLIAIFIVVMLFLKPFYRIIPTNRDKELQYIHEINRKQHQIDSLNRINKDIIKRYQQDSAAFKDRIDKINKQINRIKTSASKINYKHYFVPQLDSIGEVLYPTPR